MVNVILLTIGLTLAKCQAAHQVIDIAECRKAVAEIQVIAQSAQYWGLLDYGPVMPTQMNPTFATHMMDNRGTRTNMIDSSR